jgi:hypothetical protein
MNIPEMLAITVAVTEFFKKAAFSLFKVEIKARAAVVLAVLTSLGVVIYKAVETGTAVNLALVPLAIQVIIGSTIGYSIATKK